MNNVPINEVFDIEYGNQLNFNAATLAEDGINFVTRSRSNLGIGGKIAQITGRLPYPAGLITVSMGGNYLLSAFVQPAPFYTAQNIKVLKPKAGEHMCFNELIFYCSCISANRFRYSSHGREANRSFDGLLVPPRSAVPAWVKHTTVESTALGLSLSDLSPKPNAFEQGCCPLKELFDTRNGTNPAALPTEATKADHTYVPIVRPSKTQASSYAEYVSTRDVHPHLVFPEETLYVSTNGQGSHTYAYVSAFKFVPNTDVVVLIDRSSKMGLVEKLFYASAISTNRWLFSYGRKPKGTRLDDLLIPKCPPEFVYDKNIITRIRQSKLTLT